MLTDKLNTLCDATALSTSGTGRAVVGSQIDLSAAQRDIGEGTPVELVVTVHTTCTSGGSATVSFEIVSDSTAALATDGTSTEHIVTQAFPVASLVAGFEIWRGPLPKEGPTYERYLGILQNVGTAALTAGKINAFIVGPNGSSKWKPMTAAR